MPVDSRHPLYETNLEAWRRCRDAYDGEDAVKLRGKLYLPKPGGQDDEEYAGYTSRALYYEAVGRTVDGFVGAIARKDPEITLPAKLAALMEDATADGLSLPELIKRVCAEAMLIGRGAILVDFHEEQNRPYLALYTAENVINWRKDRVVLTETVYEPDPEDDFKLVAIEQCRELALDNGRYVARLWRKARGERGELEWTVYQTLNPSNRGKPLNEIPLYWITPLGRTDTIVKPPLLGLVNVSLSHYRSSADLEHGRHFSGLPTFYVTGYVKRPEDEPILIGSTAAVLLDDPQAKVGYADFNGSGLGSLEKALEDKEHMMAVLGAAVFADGKKGVEAAETARIRTSGETSLLMGVVQAAEACLTAALTAAAAWAGAPGKVEVTLNREFVDITLEPQTLSALVAAYQAGALSLEQFLYNMQAGEMLAPDTDITEEAAALTAAAEKKAKDALEGQVVLKQTAPPAKPTK